MGLKSRHLSPILRPVAHEGLVYASSGRLDVDLGSRLGPLGILLLICEQIFEIIVFLCQGATRGTMRKHAIILGRNCLRRLLREAVLELQLGLVLALAPHLVRATGRHHLNLTVHLLLIAILKLH